MAQATIPFQIRLTPELREKIEKEAQSKGESMNAAINRLIEYAFWVSEGFGKGEES